MWVYSLPIVLTMTIAVIILGGGAAAVHWLLNRRGWRGFREHNDIVGFILTVVGAIYAVVLGFVAVIVWEQYEGSRQNEQREINALSALYQLADAYPAPSRDDFRRRILRYVGLVIDDEWPAMRRGSESAAAAKAATAISDEAILLQHRPVGGSPEARSTVASETMSLVRRALDARTERIQDNHNGIPLVLWMALLVGGLITIGFGYLFGIENERLHAVATACIAAIVAVMLVLISQLDYPFRGDSGIPPTDWQIARSAFEAAR